jgi:hypothetical protein
MTSLFVLLTSFSLGAPAPVPRDSTSVADGEDVTVLNVKDCEIPLRVRADLIEKVAEVHLHVSDDEGKTWRIVQSVAAEATAFTFTAPRPGMYWLRVQVAFKDGTFEPTEIKGKTTDQKLRYKPGTPRVATAPARMP